MIELIRQRIAAAPDTEGKINGARETLQILMLKILFDRGDFGNIAFTGGAALRILHGMRRYSEDMDFSLVQKTGYDFKAIADGLAGECGKNNIAVEAGKLKLEGAVHSCFLKFPGLFSRLGIPGNPKQNFLIKIEVDSNPPAGGTTVIVPVTDLFVMAVKTFDLPSLFATKLHACLFRKYTKGRDYYDLVWYLGKKVRPNLELLNNAIRQTQGEGIRVDDSNYKSVVAERVSRVDFRRIRADVEVFLEDKAELKLLDRDLILAMLAQ